eukprot:2621462-Amphidinium_carterae.1
MTWLGTLEGLETWGTIAVCVTNRMTLIRMLRTCSGFRALACSAMLHTLFCRHLLLMSWPLATSAHTRTQQSLAANPRRASSPWDFDLPQPAYAAKDGGHFCYCPTSEATCGKDSLRWAVSPCDHVLRKGLDLCSPSSGLRGTLSSAPSSLWLGT